MCAIFVSNPSALFSCRRVAWMTLSDQFSRQSQDIIVPPAALPPLPCCHRLSSLPVATVRYQYQRLLQWSIEILYYLSRRESVFYLLSLEPWHANLTTRTTQALPLTPWILIRILEKKKKVRSTTKDPISRGRGVPAQDECS